MKVQKRLSRAHQQLVRLGLRVNSTLLSLGFAIFISLLRYAGVLPFPFDYVLLITGLLFLVASANYVALACVFLDDFAFHSIPKHKFVNIIKPLEAEAIKIQRLGFEEIDRLYVKTTVNSIQFVFKHQQENIILTLNAFANGGRHFRSVNLVTSFENNLSVTTTTSHSIHLPRPKNFYLQAIGTVDYYPLLEAHRDAIEIFGDRGYHPRDMLEEPWRSRCVRVEREFVGYVMSIPFWNLRGPFWVWFKAGKKYQLTLRDQLARKMIEIP